LQFGNHGFGYGCRCSGTSERVSDKSVVVEHFVAIICVFNKGTDFFYQSVRIAIILDEFSECKLVYDKVT
jgi:hypothetical protein